YRPVESSQYVRQPVTEHRSDLNGHEFIRPVLDHPVLDRAVLDRPVPDLPRTEHPVSYDAADSQCETADDIIELYTPHEPKRQFSFTAADESVPSLRNASEQWSSAFNRSVIVTDIGASSAYGGGEYTPPKTSRSSHLPPDNERSRYVDLADVPRPLNTGTRYSMELQSAQSSRSRAGSYQDLKAQSYIAEINGTKAYRVM
ncbi:hypothetical protein LTR95_019595, partial [Oleoguttula sp. CCFEE 5521]